MNEKNVNKFHLS